jgi:hypothetical protein
MPEKILPGEFLLSRGGVARHAKQHGRFAKFKCRSRNVSMQHIDSDADGRCTQIIPFAYQRLAEPLRLGRVPKP